MPNQAIEPTDNLHFELYNTVGMPVIVINYNLDILFANPRADRFFVFENQTDTIPSLNSYLPPPISERLLKVIRSDTHLHDTIELVVITGNHQRKICEVHISHDIERHYAILTIHDRTSLNTIEVQLREEITIARALNNFSRNITQRHNLVDIFDISVNEIRNVIIFDRLFVCLIVAPNLLNITYSFPRIPKLEGSKIDIGSTNSILSTVIRRTSTSRLVHLDEISANDELKRFASENTKALLIFPLRFRNDQLGAIVFDIYQPGQISSKRIRFLEQICQLLSNAVVNAQFISKERDSLQLFNLINQVSTGSLGSLNVQSLLKEAAERIHSLFKYYNVHILLIDKKNKCLVLNNSVGAYENEIKLGMKVPFGIGLSGRAYTEGHTILSNNIKEDARYLAEIPRTEHNAELAIPIRDQEEIHGIIDLQAKEVGTFNSQAITAMETLAVQLGNALRKANLYDKLAKQTRQLESYRRLINTDLTLASRIQNRILPLDFIDPDISVAVRYEAHAEIGGDYAHLTREDEYLYIIIGDVSGHGISSALVTTAIMNELARETRSKYPVNEVARNLNQFIFRTFEHVGMYSTFFIARFNTLTSELEYINGGHPYPILLYSNGQTALLEGDSYPLGLVDEEFDNFLNVSTLILPEQTKLILFTDGMYYIEKNDELFGDKNLLEIAKRDANEHINILADRIWQGREKAGARINDDRLLMVVEFSSEHSVFEHFDSIERSEKLIEKIIKIGQMLNYPDNEILTLSYGLETLMNNAVAHFQQAEKTKYASIKGVFSDDSYQYTVTNQGSVIEWQVLPDKNKPFTSDINVQNTALDMLRGMVNEVSINDNESSITISQKIIFELKTK